MSESDWETAPFKPDWVSPPGETISDLLEERGVSVAEFAESMGMELGDADALLTGKLEITLEMTHRLEKVLGASAPFWANRELHYRQDLERLGKK